MGFNEGEMHSCVLPTHSISIFSLAGDFFNIVLAGRRRGANTAVYSVYVSDVIVAASLEEYRIRQFRTLLLGDAWRHRRTHLS